MCEAVGWAHLIPMENVKSQKGYIQGERLKLTPLNFLVQDPIKTGPEFLLCKNDYKRDFELEKFKGGGRL